MKQRVLSKTEKEYISRIHAAEDYIEKHLDKELSLNEIAKVTGFSKYHFHRIFKSMVGETLYSYINRKRIERAAGFLIYNPELSITEIAYKLGFSSSSIFARSFNRMYGISASQFRNSNNGKIISNNGKDFEESKAYTDIVSNIKRKDDYMSVKGNVEVKNMDEMKIIYVRHTGSYKELATKFQGMMAQLGTWAGARNLIKMGETRVLTIYHDNHEITEENKMRTSICMTVTEDVTVEGEIGKSTINAGKYAIGHFKIGPAEHSDAWKYMYGEWLPNSGYQPDDGSPYEVYINDPNTHPEKLHFIDIYIPVKPL